MSWFPSSPTPGRGAHDDGVLVMPVLGASASLWMWYVARAAGIVSLLLLTGSVLLGILTSVRWFSDRWPRFTTTLVHRNLSLLAVVFLVVHVATVVIDGFAPIRWLDAIVPFASPYRPFWLGLGTVAFDLVLALIATSLLRNRIGPRLWRGTHWLAYACWPIAVVHGMGTGSDTASRRGPDRQRRVRHRGDRRDLVADPPGARAASRGAWLGARRDDRRTHRPARVAGRRSAGVRLGQSVGHARRAARAERERRDRERRALGADGQRRGPDGPSVRRFRQPSWVPSLARTARTRPRRCSSTRP